MIICMIMAMFLFMIMDVLVSMIVFFILSVIFGFVVRDLQSRMLTIGEVFYGRLDGIKLLG